MKYIFILFIVLILFTNCTTKTNKNKIVNNPTETATRISFSTNEQMNLEIEREALLFEKKLIKDYLTSEEIKFSIDTFKINLKIIKSGTIQSNIATANHFELIKNRTIQLFSHYNSIIEKEEAD